MVGFQDSSGKTSLTTDPKTVDLNANHGKSPVFHAVYFTAHSRQRQRETLNAGFVAMHQSTRKPDNRTIPTQPGMRRATLTTWSIRGFFQTSSEFPPQITSFADLPLSTVPTSFW